MKKKRKRNILNITYNSISNNSKVKHFEKETTNKFYPYIYIFLLYSFNNAKKNINKRLSQ